MKSEHIADKIAQVDRDLAELDEQVEAGELDEATAERLRSTYRAERASLEQQLDEVPDEPADDPVDGPADESVDGDETAAAAPRPGRSKGRAIAGTAIVAVAAVIVAVVAITSLKSQSTAADVTDGIATGVMENQATGGTAPAGMLDSVTTEQMEAVVAENPDVVGMRMSLAELYIQEGNIDKALEHYQIVLDQDPQNAEALVRTGWLLSLKDDPEAAEPYFVRAIEIDRAFPQAYWFLANVRFDLNNRKGAIKPLESLLEFMDIPDEIRTEAQKMLEEARS